MTHAWCHDIARDERIRAAEDGRDRPLPTLGEAIVLAFGFDKASAQRACDEVNSWPDDMQAHCRFVLGDLLEQGVEGLQALVEAWRYGKGLMEARYREMIPKSVSATSAVEQENKGDDMATKSEIQAADYQAEAIAAVRERRSDHTKGEEMSQGITTERVTLEVIGWAHGVPSSGVMSDCLKSCGLLAIDKPSYVRVVEDQRESHLDAQRGVIETLTRQRDAAIRERDSAVTESERRLRLCETMKRDGDSARFHAAVAQARVAELEAASGGGEGEPVAWGVRQRRGGRVF